MAFKIVIILLVLACACKSYQQIVEPEVDSETVRATLNENIENDLPQVAIDCKSKTNAVDQSPLFAATTEPFSDELKVKRIFVFNDFFYCLIYFLNSVI